MWRLPKHSFHCFSLTISFTECNGGHSHYPRIEMLVILTEDCIGAGIW
ncbi:hypothetical protein RchiOBHm_Chr2g0135881 [Rosa chinensis]|uniref:Uncharacterized protein n=1 Tax=Rosa chinensis TaxID=74649 RepID=A0A2P6RW69_ROSCH|nr:hypothetical protein RchiOBHm_Chr2g0135881 [Rosa chinensis]